MKTTNQHHGWKKGLVFATCLMGVVALAQSVVRIQPYCNESSAEKSASSSYEEYQQDLQILMQTIPHKESSFWGTTFNWGDDEIMNAVGGNSHLTRYIDEGDYSNWYQNAQSFLHTDNLNALSQDKFYHSLEHAWYCINLCNQDLENLSKITAGCTATQKNEVEGQLLFYRAWWHEELMTYFGAMPYIDYVLKNTEIVKVPRLSAKECAERCAADFARAAELLPADSQRATPTSLAARAYQGKVLLWAASPLNNLGAQTGALANGNTYKYNTELAKKAAGALGVALTSVQNGETPYELAAFHFGEGVTEAIDNPEVDLYESAEKEIAATVTYTDGNFPFYPMGCKPPIIDGAIHFVPNGDWSQFFLADNSTISLEPGFYSAVLEVKSNKIGNITLTVQNGWGDQQMINVDVPLSSEWEEVEVRLGKLTGVPSTLYDFILKPEMFDGTVDVRSLKVIHYLIPEKETVWVNHILNSAMDPSLTMENFIARDQNKNDEPAEVLIGGGPDGGNCIVITAKTNPTEEWDTQFFIYTPDKIWKAGERYRLHMNYKASKAIGTDTQVHVNPGDYKHWQMLSPNPYFTTDWQETTWEGTIPMEGGSKQQTIAFSLNKNAYDDPDTEYLYYFANITWESLCNVDENGEAITDKVVTIHDHSKPYKSAIKDVYNHVKPKDCDNFYTDIFYTTNQGWEDPGAKEAIFSGFTFGANSSNWNFSKLWGPKVNGIVAQDKIIHLPTANYVNYAYGMANGLPLTDPDSGFDPAHPFKDRDPRFYHDIVFDGFEYINSSVDRYEEDYKYAQLYTGGNMRDDELGSRTGYFCQKLVPHTANKYDGAYEWNGALQCYLPYLRLADIYLLYAEACAAYGSASTSNNCQLTAEEAINTLRDRVGAGHVAEKYLSDAKKFMDEVRRERACELAFEGHRWADLSRWLLLTEAPYNKKTSQEFIRVTTELDNPQNEEVGRWSEKEILTRKLDASHYVFPLDPDSPPETDIIYSEDGKTLIYYPSPSKATKFVIPQTVEVLADGCFKNCSALTIIVGHDGIKEIGKEAFMGTSIKNFELPANVTKLGDRCFQGTRLREFTIPSRVDSVGEECFAGCTMLEKITIEEGVKSIGTKCFDGDLVLKSVEIPASVTHIGPSAFNAYAWRTAGNLEEIKVSKKNENYVSVDGILYNKELTHLIQVPNKYKGELNIPSTVVEVDDYSIYFCTELTKVVVPASVKRLGYYAFSNCSKLTEIICYPDSVPEAYFGSVTNEDFTGIKMYVPAEAKENYRSSHGFLAVPEIYAIGENAQNNPLDFVFTRRLERTGSSSGYEVLFPDPNNSRWIELESPDGYTYGVEGPSDRNIIDHITELYLDGVKIDSTEYIKYVDLGEDLGVQKLFVLPYRCGARSIVLRTDGKITEINDIAHANSYRVKLPDSIKKIGKNNFLYSGIYIVDLPEGLEEMGDSCLVEYLAPEVFIPKNVAKIGKHAFLSDYISSITVDPENPYFISVDGVLFNKDMTELIYYPLLKSDDEFIIPETVKKIAPGAITNCIIQTPDKVSPSQLVIPASVTEIGEGLGARNFASVTCLATTPPKLGDNAMSGVLYVPVENLKTYQDDKQWSKYFTILPMPLECDLNEDGTIDADDFFGQVETILELIPEEQKEKMDVDKDGELTVKDIVMMINMVNAQR